MLLLLACSTEIHTPDLTDPSGGADTPPSSQTDPGSEAEPDAEPEPEAGPPEALAPWGERRCEGRDVLPTWDPAQRGPFPVGVRTIEVYDPVRDRTLLTEVWYPADESARGQAGETYGIGWEEAAAMAGQEWMLLLALLNDDDLLTLVETDAVRDAPAAAQDESRGVVLFSHGYRGIRFQSTFLTSWLASHGYVVLASDHVGNTMFDGSSEDMDAVFDRMEDMAALTDALPELADEFSFDPTRVAWTGHSFGASTVLMGGARDNREMVSIPLAPMFDERMAGVYAPPSYDLRSALVVVGGSEDTTTPWDHQSLAYDRTVAPRHLVQLDGMRHFDLTDLCANPLFKDVVTNMVDELNGACGEQDGVYHHAVQTVVTSALNRYLACDPDALDLEHELVSVLESVQPEPLQPESWTFPDWPDAWETGVLYDGVGDHVVVLVSDQHPSVWAGLELAAPFVVTTPDQLDATVAGLDAPVVVAHGSVGPRAMQLQGLSGLVLMSSAPAADQHWSDWPDYNGGLTLDASARLAQGRDLPLVLPGNPHAAALANLQPAPDWSVDALGVHPDAPVLLLHGERDDVVLLESSLYLQRTLSDASLVLLQRSGHLPMLEEPTTVAWAIGEFLDALP